MKKTMLRKYARLIVKMGVNLQKGQGCLISAAVEQHAFALLVQEEAYRAGAKWVRMDWVCQAAAKLKYRNESVTTLSKVPLWEEEKARYTVDTLPAMIHIVSDDPDGLKGVSVEKLQKTSIARMKVLKPYRDATEDKNQWTIVAVPSEKWAKKVFPDMRGSAAVSRLWEAILSTVRITADNDPVAQWEAHNQTLQANCDKLNQMNLDYIHMKNDLGTDFKCWMIPQGQWKGGGDTLINGTFYNPNMPTEEVFISPMKGKAEGTVVSTKPLSYQGQLIDDFSITFADGKAVAWRAKEGEALLERMIHMDEGAAMLGEVALIPHRSPISDTGVLFYNTLFDENASCHLALGRGFAGTLKGYETMTKQEQDDMGLNDSLIHVDFMIGSADMDITGYTKQGKVIPIFKNGAWVI